MDAIKQWGHLQLGWNLTTMPAMKVGATICSATQTVVPWSVLPARVTYMNEGAAEFDGGKGVREAAGLCRAAVRTGRAQAADQVLGVDQGRGLEWCGKPPQRRSCLAFHHGVLFFPQEQNLRAYHLGRTQAGAPSLLLLLLLVLLVLQASALLWACARWRATSWQGRSALQWRCCRMGRSGEELRVAGHGPDTLWWAD